jgi:hypothetical protein
MERKWIHKYKVASPASVGKKDLGLTDTLLLPESALGELNKRGFEFPVYFLAVNVGAPGSDAGGRERRVACVAQEFTAPPETAVMSTWLSRHLALKDGDAVVVRAAQLPKGQAAVFKPLVRAFYELGDPKIALEEILGSYRTLTKGTVVHGGNDLAFEIQELCPAAHVSIVDVDLRVDFAEPDFDVRGSEAPVCERAREPGAASRPGGRSEIAERQGEAESPELEKGSRAESEAPATATGQIGGDPAQVEGLGERSTGFVAFSGKSCRLADDGPLSSANKRCPSCGGLVPAESLELHELRCPRAKRGIRAPEKRRSPRLLCPECLKSFASPPDLSLHLAACGKKPKRS